MAHCPVCRLTVAPYDPERVQVGLEVFHRGCRRSAQRKEHEQKNPSVRIKLSLANLQALQQHYDW